MDESKTLWGRPPSGLSDELRAAAAEILDLEGGAERYAFAAVAGSLVAGLGHSLSDVDIYVVPRPGVAVSTRQHERAGRMIQLNEVTPERFDRLCSIGSSFVATARDRIDLDLADLDLKYLVNLTIADILYADERTTKVHDSIDPNAVRRLLMVTRTLDVARHAEDCHGALGSGDALVAIRAAQLALQHALDVGATAAGELYQGKHFLYEKAVRGGVLDETNWHLVERAVPWGAQHAELTQYAVTCLDYACHLTAQGMFNGWESPLPAVPTLPANPTGPRRNPYYSLVRFTDGSALCGPYRGLRISHDVALLWSLLDGSAPADVAARAAEATDGRITADDVSKAVGRLRTLEVVRDPAGTPRTMPVAAGGGR